MIAVGSEPRKFVPPPSLFKLDTFLGSIAGLIVIHSCLHDNQVYHHLSSWLCANPVPSKDHLRIRSTSINPRYRSLHVPSRGSVLREFPLNKLKEPSLQNSSSLHPRPIWCGTSRISSSGITLPSSTPQSTYTSSPLLSSAFFVLHSPFSIECASNKAESFSQQTHTSTFSPSKQSSVAAAYSAVWSSPFTVIEIIQSQGWAKFDHSSSS